MTKTKTKTKNEMPGFSEDALARIFGFKHADLLVHRADNKHDFAIKAYTPEAAEFLGKIANDSKTRESLTVAPESIDWMIATAHCANFVIRFASGVDR